MDQSCEPSAIHSASNRTQRVLKSGAVRCTPDWLFGGIPRSAGTLVSYYDLRLYRVVTDSPRFDNRRWIRRFKRSVSKDSGSRRDSAREMDYGGSMSKAPCGARAVGTRWGSLESSGLLRWKPEPVTMGPESRGGASRRCRILSRRRRAAAAIRYP